MKKPCARIEAVLPNSPAARLQIKAGEILRSINGQPMRDMIDYQYGIADEVLELEIEDIGGILRRMTLQKEYDDDPGILFEGAVFDGIRLCGNACIFCFVDQMAPGQRETLYVKDDDYRLSFLYGNYITLTNLTEADFQRIERERLSPLYISVHSLDPEIHRQLLGRKKAFPLFERMERLADAGIQMHGQIVLVPGYNDGEELEKTVQALDSFGEAMLSVALVPVGLTKYKNPALRVFTEGEAKTVLDFVAENQPRFLKERGTRFLFASDEFYLLAKEEIPLEEDYEDYPQIENGVGLMRLFWEDFYEEMAESTALSAGHETLVLITGKDGAAALAPVVAFLRDNCKQAVEILTVENHFFGSTVTVTGLLSGDDIITAIRAHGTEDKRFLLPDIVLRKNETILLDDVTVEDIVASTGANLEIVASDGCGFAAYLAALGKDKA